MAEGSGLAAAAVELVFAVAALMLSGLFGLWWWVRREDRYLVWLAAWAAAAAATLGIQAALFALERTSMWVEPLVALRTLALGALTALVVPPVCLLAGRRVAWWLVNLVGAVYLVRWALTAGTDLLWDGSFDAQGLPSYEPLRAVFMFTPLFTMILLVPYVRRIRHAGQRQLLYIAMVAALLPVPVAAVQPDPIARELATGAWSLPIIAALTLIGLRRVVEEEASRRRLVERQRALLRLGETDAAELVAAAEEHLHRDLGSPVTVTVSRRSAAHQDPGRQDRGHRGPEAGAVEAQGHRSFATAEVRGRAEPLTPSEESFVRSVLHLVAGAEDRAAAEHDLRQAALYDGLTGLPNRVLLTDRLEHAIDRLDRTGGLLAVLFCDLDEFKEVNDTFGHEAGDTLLVEVAGALQSVARSSDTVARYGGDEFVVVAEELGEPAEGVLVAHRMQRTAQRVVNPATGRPVRMSVGLVCAGRGERSATRLLRAADVAMYRAKAGEADGGVAVGELPENGLRSGVD